MSLFLLPACGDDVRGGASDATSADAQSPADAADGAVPPPDAGPDARVLESGDFAWVRVFPGGVYATELAADPTGGVVVAGWLDSSLDLGDRTLTTAGEVDAFIVRFDLDGEVLWARAIGAEGSDRLSEVAVAPDGDVVAVGNFDSEEVDFGTGPIARQGSGENGFVLRLDADDGATSWVDTYPTYGIFSEALAIAPDGDAVALGVVTGGHRVTRYAPDGEERWSQLLPLGGYGMTDVVVSAAGVTSVFGEFGGTITHGVSTLTESATDPDDWDHAVLQLDAAGVPAGAVHLVEDYVWFTTFAGGPEGDLLIGGNLDGGSIHIDGATIEETTGSWNDTFLLRLSDSGLTWSLVSPGDSFGGSHPMTVTTSAGGIYVATLCRAATAPDSPLPCPAAAVSGGTALTRLEPGGAHDWTTTVSATSHAWVEGAALGSDGLLHVAGDVADDGDFGGLVVPGRGLFVGAVVP